MVEAFTPR
jgi:hypothetical protein